MSLVPVVVYSKGFSLDQYAVVNCFKLWLIHWFITITFTSVQIYSHYAAKAVVFTVFHVFLLILEIASIGCFSMFSINAIELCQFFNQLRSRRNEFAFWQNLVKLPRKTVIQEHVFYMMLLTCFFAGNVLFWVTIPLIFYSVPDLLSSKFMPCTVSSALSFGLIRVFLHWFLFIPSGIVGASATVVSFVAMEAVCTELQTLRLLVLRARVIYNKQEVILQLGINYRQIQIFVLVANRCFQAHFLPLVMFCGAAALICLFYVLITHANQLHRVLAMGFLGFALLIACVTLYLLDQFSNPVVISSNILVAAKQTRNTAYANKFFRSCQRIAIRVGELHLMDKERVGAYIRFVLQRTSLLVFKFKSGA